MKKIFTLALFTGAMFFVNAQEPALDSWILNTTGKTSSYWENTAGQGQAPSYVLQSSSTLADVTDICFSADSIWIKSEGMTNDMGQFTNPGTPSGQGYTFSFPRNPAAGSGSEAVPEVNTIGVLTNGIPIYGLGDGKSYSARDKVNSNQGDGKWVGEAYYTEGSTLDTAFAAHPQQQGAYHSHATPFRLYSDPSTAHSPIVGYAHDGFPVYGPFGYASALDKNSGTTRMVSGYQLRNITMRTTLPDGSNSMPPGPAVTNGGDYDLGSYIQDYEFVQGVGTLDEHNGRMCVTPEYPGGTYAYFVTVDAAGTPQFPYYVGTTYYGTPVSSNNGGTATMPTSGLTCLPLATHVRTSDFVQTEVQVYPNPTSGAVSYALPNSAKGYFDIKIIDVNGSMVYSSAMVNATGQIDVSNLNRGVYTVRIIGYNQLYTAAIVKQ